jgi:hypothetical protein
MGRCRPLHRSSRRRHQKKATRMQIGGNYGRELVVISAGEFMMGSEDGGKDEKAHKVTIRMPFAVASSAATMTPAWRRSQPQCTVVVALGGAGWLPRYARVSVADLGCALPAPARFRDFGPAWREGLTRWTIARADLHRPTCIADDAAPRIVDRPGHPVAPGPVYRLPVASVHHIARRPRGNDRAADDDAPDDAGCNARPPTPSPASPLGRGICRCRGQCHCDRCSRE